MAIDPETQAAFLATLRQSGLIDESQLNEVMQELADFVSLPFGNSVTSLTMTLVGRGLLTSWQVAKLREGKHKGYWLDDFLLLDYLSSSPDSSTYLARDRKNTKLCKVKVFPRWLENTTEHRYEVEDL